MYESGRISGPGARAYRKRPTRAPGGDPPGLWCVSLKETHAALAKGITGSSTAVAIFLGYFFSMGVFHDSMPLLYFFVLRKSVRVPKIKVVAPP